MVSIASLIPDVLTEIFFHCSPSEPSFRSWDAPLLLSHVCRNWRKMVLSSQLSWSHIAIPKWKDCPKGVTDLTRLWLTRSGCHTLTVEINLTDRRMYDLDKNEAAEESMLLQAIIEMLAPHRDRIRILRGAFPNRFISKLGIHGMMRAECLCYAGRFLSSEDFYPHNIGESGETQYMTLSIGPAREPLTQLKISNCRVQMETVSIQTQLTHLELSRLHRSSKLCAETTLNLLIRLSSLKVAKLDVYAWIDVAIADRNARFELPNLQVLALLSAKSRFLVPTVLRNIYAPNLRELHTTGTIMTTPGRDLEALHGFLQASQAPLQQLTLSHYSENTSLALGCLVSCPELQHLKWDDYEVDETTLQAVMALAQCGRNHIFSRCEDIDLPVEFHLPSDHVLLCFVPCSRCACLIFSRSRAQ